MSESLFLNIESHTQFIVISDIHLKDPQDKLTELFIETITSLKEPQPIYLIGDIFEFISFKHKYFIKLWSNVFDLFESKIKEGFSIYFIEGNHDYNTLKKTSYFTWAGKENRIVTHPLLGVIQLSHGDTIIRSTSYALLRMILKSKILGFISLLFPGILLSEICKRFAQRSRRHEKPINTNFVTENLHKRWPKGINTLIIGHIHMYFHALDTQKRSFFVSPSWQEAPSYLQITEKNAQRVFLNQSCEPIHIDEFL